MGLEAYTIEAYAITDGLYFRKYATFTHFKRTQDHVNTVDRAFPWPWRACARVMLEA